MKRLCFGTLLNLIYQARSQGVTYKNICENVFEAFGAAGCENRDGSLPSHLKSGHDNVPTDVIDSARDSNYEDVVDCFEESVSPLVTEEKKKDFIFAIRTILEEDPVEEDVPLGYNSDFTKREILERNKFKFSPLLASLFYYTIVNVSNYNCQESLKSFEKDYLSMVNVKGQIFIDPLHNRVDEVDDSIPLKKTLDDPRFGQSFKKIGSVRINEMTHPSTADIYCVDVRNTKLSFSKAKTYLIENIGTYVFSRSKVNRFSDMHSPASALGVQALLTFQKAYGANAEAMLGELLLYVFLEQELNAPKILSKVEFKQQAGGIQSKSDGVHLLMTQEFGRPFNQLVFGASNIEGDLLSAADRAIERITDIEANADLEFSMVENTSQHFVFDDATNEYIRDIMIPRKSYTSKPDMAFGLFLGYTLKLDKPEMDPALFRKAADEQLHSDIEKLKEHLRQKIQEKGLQGYSLYCYVLPFNDAPSERTGLIDEMLEGGDY